MAADQTPCSSDAGNNTPSYDEATTTSSQFPSTTATPLISPVVGPKPVKVKSRWRRTSELEQVTRNGGNGGPGSDQGSSCNNSPSQSQSVSSSPKQTAFSCSVPLEELTSATDNYTNKRGREKKQLLCWLKDLRNLTFWKKICT